MSVGLGIRPELFETVLAHKPDLGLLEAHSENYFGESVLRAKLRDLREIYDISLHGVGLSLGRADNLDEDHLIKLKALVDEINPILVSEHLAWSAYSHRHIPDLLPLPLNERSLIVMCEHVERMQTVLQRQILIENPSNYLVFEELQIPEAEFLNLLAERTGCGLLVDLNNICVSAHNVGRDPLLYVESLDTQLISQYHLAGYTEVERGGEKVLIDTHDHQVYPEVWDLYRQTIELHGARPTIFEWDSDFPELSVLQGECDKADKLVQQYCSEIKQKKLIAEGAVTTTRPFSDQQLEFMPTAEFQRLFLDKLLDGTSNLPQVPTDHQHRFWIYQNNMYGATQDYLADVYPAVSGVVGADYFNQLVHYFVKTNPPSRGDIHLYGDKFYCVLDEFDALEKLPYLRDLIKFEWALHHSYFCSIDGELNLNQTPQEELLALAVDLNVSVGVISSDYPILEIHRQSLPSYGGAVSIELSQGGDNILVYKNKLAVQTSLIDERHLKFLDILKNTDNLLQAIEGAGRSQSTEEVSAILAWVLGLGLLCKSGDVIG